jgi:hypothetical protein
MTLLMHVHFSTLQVIPAKLPNFPQKYPNVQSLTVFIQATQSFLLQVRRRHFAQGANGAI